MRPPEQVKKELVRQWLAKAEQDIAASQALLGVHPPLAYAVCFHAQQAAEKYLKAFLTWHQVEFPKTHSIDELLKLAENADPGLSNLLQDTVALTPYGVDIRYPGEAVEPSQSEAEEAMRLAEEVQRVVLDSLPFR